MKLRTKYFLMLAVGPLLSLVFFFLVATVVFIQDKISYVVDMQVSQVGQLSRSIHKTAKVQNAQKLTRTTLEELMPIRDYLDIYVMDDKGNIQAISSEEKTPKNISEILSSETTQRLFSDGSSSESFEGQGVDKESWPAPFNLSQKMR